MLSEALWVISASQGWFRTSEHQNGEASRRPFEVQVEPCFAKMCVFRSVSEECFCNILWVTAKVVRRVFVWEGACFSLSHQSSKNVKRASFLDPGWKHLSLKVVYRTVPKVKNDNTWYGYPSPRAMPPFKSSQDVRPRRPDGTIWRGKLKAESKKHTILDHTLG